MTELLKLPSGWTRYDFSISATIQYFHVIIIHDVIENDY
jgi:hypothetical protein